MILCGLDIATTTGLACFKDGIFTTATFKGNKVKKETDGLDPVREGEIGRLFQDLLRVWLIENRVEYVAIEAPISSAHVRRKAVINPQASFAGQAITYTNQPATSMSAIYRIYGLSFAAAAVCSRLNIPAVMVVQQTWRKAFLGSGHIPDAKKAAKAKCEALGIKISSVDAAEAVGIAYWLKERLLGPGMLR